MRLIGVTVATMNGKRSSLDVLHKHYDDVKIEARPIAIYYRTACWRKHPNVLVLFLTENISLQFSPVGGLNFLLRHVFIRSASIDLVYTS